MEWPRGGVILGQTQKKYKYGGLGCSCLVKNYTLFKMRNTPWRHDKSHYLHYIASRVKKYNNLFLCYLLFTWNCVIWKKFPRLFVINVDKSFEKTKSWWSLICIKVKCEQIPIPRLHRRSRHHKWNFWRNIRGSGNSPQEDIRDIKEYFTNISMKSP